MRSKRIVSKPLLCLVLSLNLVIAAKSGAQEGSVQEPPPDMKLEAGAQSSLEVQYTGALFGYYRIEAEPGLQVLKAPQDFIHDSEIANHKILLGMGDTFGPEFGASVEREWGSSGRGKKGDPCYLPIDPRNPEQNAPGSLYKSSDRLPRLAECDNVGRFLLQAGYSALVPGREDLLYSATWLRRMALLLRGAGKNNPAPNPFVDGASVPGRTWVTAPFQPSIMKAVPLLLAANLRIQFDDKAAAKRSQGKPSGHTCPLLFSWDPVNADKNSCVADAGEKFTVTADMDWLRRTDLTLRVEKNVFRDSSVAYSINQQALQDADFRHTLLSNQLQIAQTLIEENLFESSCPVDVASAVKQFLDDAKENLHDLGGLNAGPPREGYPAGFPSDSQKSRDNALTDSLASRKDPNAQACGRMLVDLRTVVDGLDQRFGFLGQAQSIPAEQQRFLLSTDARLSAEHLLLRKIAFEQQEVGYAYVGDGGDPNLRTVVIGVVGPETLNAVSPSNLGLCLDAMPKPGDQTVVKPCSNQKGSQTETVIVGDSVLAVSSLVRAVWERRSEEPYAHVVVLAQMPHTEAEELESQVRAKLIKSCGTDAACPWIDLIISEPQQGHRTPNLELHYGAHDQIPVVSPKLAWYINDEKLVDPISLATLTSDAPNPERRTLVNDEYRDPTATSLAEGERPSSPIDEKVPSDSPPRARNDMAKFLHQELQEKIKVGGSHVAVDLANFEDLWGKCKSNSNCEDAVIMQYLLEEMHRSSHADVVFLERRDFYFGELLDQYGGYDLCDEREIGPPTTLTAGARVDWRMSKAYCQLRVALDRVLWKGDFSERVMVDGKTLKSLFAAAKQEAEAEQGLAARDTTEEWLETFGVVTAPPKNLTLASMGPETFSVPGEAFCKGGQPDGSGGSTYCVNGQAITDDGAYWIATSDHLAQDTQIYKQLSALNTAGYHEKKEDLFITREIADDIFTQPNSRDAENLSELGDAANGMSKVENFQQIRPILALDYSKVVAGFMIRKPSLADLQLGNAYSGVADSRATTPHAQELDLESQTRSTMGLGVGKGLQRITFGLQSDEEYDRAVTGNIIGNPETVTYALNSFTTGGFAQFNFTPDKLLPRWRIVLAPYQYQQQITGNHLNFKFTTGTGQITVATPTWAGFSQRVGARFEMGGGKWWIPDPSSYAEAGPELTVVNHVLSGLLLPNGITCPASEVAFSKCVASSITVAAGLKIKPLTETVHEGGAYWDVHLQKAFAKPKGGSGSAGSSFTLESKGDDYMLPGATLPTQSRYAFTTSAAVNWTAIGNLVFSPTFSTFFYRNQGNRQETQSLVTNSFSVTAKWYFFRDAAVAPWRQIRFKGPASLSQTSTAKMK